MLLSVLYIIGITAEGITGALAAGREKMDIFSDEGYTVKWKVLNAWDYGVAQKRERMIMVGVRNDLADIISFDYPEPHEYKPVLRDILLDINKTL